MFTNLLGLLLPATFVSWILAVQHFRSERTPASLRISAAIALVLLGAAVIVETELLSLFHALSFWPILIFWVLALAGSIPFAGKGVASATMRMRRLRPRGGMEWVLAAAAILVILATGISAQLFPPQTYDTLAYHLPRQIMWAQQASVEHFDSGKFRNLNMQPFSEFIGVQLLILTGRDFWHTSIQWVYVIAGLCAVSRLVKSAGGSRSAQWLAALFIVTFPAAYYEATSCKNDLMLGVLLILLIVFAMAPRNLAGSYRQACLLGLILGSALLTKGTAYIFAAPIVIWLVWKFWQAQGVRFARPLVVMLLVAAALNAGYWGRNYHVFGRIMGPQRAEADVIVENQSRTPARILSVAARNVASLSITPFDSVNRWMLQGIIALHQQLGLDVNDEATTYVLPFDLSAKAVYVEERASSILHNLLACVGIVLALVMARRRFGLAASLSIFILISFLMFCIYLRWQQWHVRLVLPLIFLAGPVVGLSLSFQRWRGVVAQSIAAALLLAAFVPVLIFGPRPLFAREAWTESERTKISAVERDKARITAGVEVWCKVMESRPEITDIGILNRKYDEADYMVMRAMMDRVPHPLRFHYVNPVVRVPESTPAKIDAIVSLGDALHVTDTASGKSFAAIIHSPPYTFYLPDQLPELADVPLIVQGEVVTVNPLTEDGLGAAVVRVESVLRGPAVMQQVQVVTFSNQFFKKQSSSSARCKIGDRGIWLLKPSPVKGYYKLESAQYLRPDADLPEIQKALSAK